MHLTIPPYRDNLANITANKTMPSRDIYHNTVKNALEKTAGKLPHYPLFIKYGEKNFFDTLPKIENETNRR